MTGAAPPARTTKPRARRRRSNSPMNWPAPAGACSPSTPPAGCWPAPGPSAATTVATARARRAAAAAPAGRRSPRPAAGPLQAPARGPRRAAAAHRAPAGLAAPGPQRAAGDPRDGPLLRRAEQAGRTGRPADRRGGLEARVSQAHQVLTLKSWKQLLAMRPGTRARAVPTRNPAMFKQSFRSLLGTWLTGLLALLPLVLTPWRCWPDRQPAQPPGGPLDADRPTARRPRPAVRQQPGPGLVRRHPGAAGQPLSPRPRRATPAPAAGLAVRPDPAAHR